MNRALILLSCASCASACRKDAAPQRFDSAPAAQSSAGASAGLAPAAESAAPTPTRSAPIPAPSPEPGREARERAVFGLLGGEQRADALPEVATSPGEAMDRNLRDQLSPVTSRLGAQHGPQGTAAISNFRAPRTIPNAERVVAGMRPGLRACYNRVLQQTPKAKGIVDFSLSVDETGTVSAADVKARAKFDPHGLSCLTARAGASRFDPPADGQAAKVAFTVTLLPPPAQ